MAEAHHFVVALALGVKIRPALAAAHGESGQRVLENLFEAQELEDAQVDRGVEAQAAFVGADGAVEFNAVAAIHLHVAGVVCPRYAEHDDALRLDDAFEHFGGFVLGMGFHEGDNGLGHFLHCLQKFGLVGVARGNSVHKRLDGGAVI